jgi:ribosomal protein L32
MGYTERVSYSLIVDADCRKKALPHRLCLLCKQRNKGAADTCANCPSSARGVSSSAEWFDSVFSS